MANQRAWTAAGECKKCLPSQISFSGAGSTSHLDRRCFYHRSYSERMCKNLKKGRSQICACPYSRSSRSGFSVKKNLWRFFGNSRESKLKFALLYSTMLQNQECKLQFALPSREIPKNLYGLDKGDLTKRPNEIYRNKSQIDDDSSSILNLGDPRHQRKYRYIADNMLLKCPQNMCLKT